MKHIMYLLCCLFSVFPICNCIDQPSSGSKQLRNKKIRVKKINPDLFRGEDFTPPPTFLLPIGFHLITQKQ